MAAPDFIKHPKFLRFRASLGIPTAYALGLCEMLWNSANLAACDTIGSADDVEREARWEGEPGKLVAALLACGSDGSPGLIEAVNGDAGAYRLHDWADHAPIHVLRKAERHEKMKARGRTLSDVRREAVSRRKDRISGTNDLQVSDACRSDVGQMSAIPPASSPPSPRVSFSPPTPPSYPSFPSPTSPPPPSPLRAYAKTGENASETPPVALATAGQAVPPSPTGSLLAALAEWAAREGSAAPTLADVARHADAIAAGPPIIRDGVKLARLDVAILATRRAKTAAREYRNLDYAIATVRGMVADDAERAARPVSAKPRDGPRRTGNLAYVEAGQERLRKLMNAA